MKHPDPNATIQLDRVDRLDDIQLDDPESPAPRVSVGPPPLPPSASLPPAHTIPSYTVSPHANARPSFVPPAASSPRKGKTIVQAVLFVALLGAAVVGGLKLGSAFRTPAPVAKIAPPVVVVEPAATASASPAAAAAPAVLTMPTVELNDKEGETK